MVTVGGQLAWGRRRPRSTKGGAARPRVLRTPRVGSWRAGLSKAVLHAEPRSVAGDVYDTSQTDPARRDGVERKHICVVFGRRSRLASCGTLLCRKS